MTEIKLTIPQDLDEKELKRVREVLLALLSCGGLFGVKGGKTIIHFDGKGEFRGVQLDYWPWRKRVFNLTDSSD